MTTMYRLGGSHLHFDIALCSTSKPATQMIPRGNRIDLIHDQPQWIIKNQLERIARTTQACFEPATNGSRVGAANGVTTMRCMRNRTCACFLEWMIAGSGSVITDVIRLTLIYGSQLQTIGFSTYSYLHSLADCFDFGCVSSISYPLRLSVRH